jgi:proton-translocating NADH-quinone oxidoreductase chain M
MLFISDLLTLVLVFPLIGAIVLLFIPFEDRRMLKLISLNFACVTFVLSIFLWIFFNKSVGIFQYVSVFSWMPLWNINFIIGIDGISLFFVLLTTLLIPLCLLASWDSIQYNTKYFVILFLLLEFMLIGAFCILDLLFFYVFFESVLIPMYFIIGIWGSRERKIRAAYFFFLYTLLGSVLMLLAILYIYNKVGTTNYEVLLTYSFSSEEQRILWLAFFFSLATKVPMVPVHLWLPEAHVEAPTSGSVILAGIFIKVEYIWFY